MRFAGLDEIGNGGRKTFNICVFFYFPSKSLILSRREGSKIPRKKSLNKNPPTKILKQKILKTKILKQKFLKQKSSNKNSPKKLQASRPLRSGTWVRCDLTGGLLWSFLKRERRAAEIRLAR
jgi:hypothetical protein